MIMMILNTKGIRHVGNLFDLSIDEDYYKPIRTNWDFNGYIEIEFESKGDKDKILSVKIYLHMIRPYLSNIINDHKTHGKLKVHSGNKIIDYKTQWEWKIQLSMAINFISSKDSDETSTMHTKSDDIEIMVSNKTDEIIEELFKSLLQKYQERLKENMRGSEFVIANVDLLQHKLHNIRLNRGASYIDSPEWLKSKKTTINPKNKFDKSFQYAVAVALNSEKIKNNLERILKIKPFVDKYSWKGIRFPSHQKDWKKIWIK